MSGKIVLVLFAYATVIDSIITPNILVGLIDHFKMKNFYIQSNCLTFVGKSEMFKIFSHRDEKINFNQKIHQQSQSMITCTTNLTSFNLNQQFNSIVIVICQIENEMDLHNINVSVGQEVYFLDKNVLKIYEAYVINHMHITRYLGQFYHTVKPIFSFSPADNFIGSIIQRRNNFHGLQLIGMIDYDPPYVIFPNNYLDKVSYFPENEMYDVTKISSGIYIDVLKNLESTINFTTKLYKRKDGIWGMPQTLPNGTVQLNGILQSVVEGPADMVCSSYALFPLRYPYLEYLPPLSHAFGALFIVNYGNYEVIDWTAYLDPFTMRLWLLIFVSTIFVIVSMKVIEKYHMKETTNLVSLIRFCFVCLLFMYQIATKESNCHLENQIDLSGGNLDIMIFYLTNILFFRT